MPLSDHHHPPVEAAAAAAHRPTFVPAPHCHITVVAATGPWLETALFIHKGLQSADHFTSTTEQGNGRSQDQIVPSSPLGVLGMFRGIPELMIAQHEEDVNALLVAANRMLQDLRGKLRRMTDLVSVVHNNNNSSSTKLSDSKGNLKQNNNTCDEGDEGDSENGAVAVVLTRIAGSVLDRSTTLVEQLRRDVSTSDTDVVDEEASTQVELGGAGAKSALECLINKWLL